MPSSGSLRDPSDSLAAIRQVIEAVLEPDVGVAGGCEGALRAFVGLCREGQKAG